MEPENDEKVVVVNLTRLTAVLALLLSLIALVVSIALGVLLL